MVREEKKNLLTLLRKKLEKKGKGASLCGGKRRRTT